MFLSGTGVHQENPGSNAMLSVAKAEYMHDKNTQLCSLLKEHLCNVISFILSYYIFITVLLLMK